MLFLGSLLAGSAFGGLSYVMTKGAGAQVRPHLQPLLEDLLREQATALMQEHVDSILGLLACAETHEDREFVDVTIGKADMSRFLKAQRLPIPASLLPAPSEVFASEGLFWVTPGEELILQAWQGDAVHYAALLRRIVEWNPARRRAWPAEEEE